MRITPFERETIKRAILKLDKEAGIFLFGSRVDDEKKGGDIDILVISGKLNSADVIDIKTDIFTYMEDQKIDIIIKNGTKDPFVEYVMADALLL